VLIERVVDPEPSDIVAGVKLAERPGMFVSSPKVKLTEPLKPSSGITVSGAVAWPLASNTSEGEFAINQKSGMSGVTGHTDCGSPVGSINVELRSCSVASCHPRKLVA